MPEAAPVTTTFLPTKVVDSASVSLSFAMLILKKVCAA